MRFEVSCGDDGGLASSATKCAGSVRAAAVVAGGAVDGRLLRPQVFDDPSCDDGCASADVVRSYSLRRCVKEVGRQQDADEGCYRTTI